MNTRESIDRAAGQRPMQIVPAEPEGWAAGPAYAAARDLCYATQNRKAEVTGSFAGASAPGNFGVIVALDRLGPVEVSTLSGRQETTPFRLSGGSPNLVAY